MYSTSYCSFRCEHNLCRSQLNKVNGQARQNEVPQLLQHIERNNLQMVVYARELASWLIRLGRDLVTDLDERDAIDTAAGQHQVAVQHRHHVADHAPTGRDRPCLELL